MGIGFGFLTIGAIIWIALVMSLFTGSIAIGRRPTDFSREIDPRRFWLLMAALFTGGGVALALGFLILTGMIPIPFGGSGTG